MGERKIKVLLTVPTFHYKDSYPYPLSLSDFPTGFAYIAAVLKEAGHEVFGCNPNNILGYASAFDMIKAIITSRILEVKPDMVGLGGLCTDYEFLKDAIGIIRQVDPNIRIVLGGQIVTNDAEFIFNDLKPDYAVTGEGEGAMVSVVNGCENKGIIRFPWEKYRSLDLMPLPDYEPFGITEMLDKYSMATRILYSYPRPYPRPFILVASRSCPFSCTFCVHGHDRPPYRARSIENVMEEIRVTYDKYKFNILIILDELFAVNKERLVDFCNAVLEGKQKYGWDFSWIFQTHASARFDTDTLKLAKEAGCYMFSYGLESASPTVLKSMNKRIKVEQVIEVMDSAREAKIGFGANLIFGDPAETQETIAESVSFWLTHCRDMFVFLTNLTPYPGSKIFNDARERGMFQDKKAYYEHIEETLPNITSMTDLDLATQRNFLEFLENNWLFVKRSPSVQLEIESTKVCKVWATCPYCGEKSLYRILKHVPPDKPVFFWMGVGCTHCNRKMKVQMDGRK